LIWILLVFMYYTANQLPAVPKVCEKKEQRLDGLFWNDINDYS
ncbi:MAG: hypothetical protein QG646_3052, partial [Euryarchaeota archaeon]|nr:hypothetical protein [Euryarchaeota archaeon]